MINTTKKAVEALLADVERVRNQDGEHRYWDLDLEDDAMLSRLLRLATTRTLTLDDLDSVKADTHAEFMEVIRKESELLRACSERRDDLKVFYVVNTAEKRLTVLAKDAQCARYFAQASDHLKDRSNGRVLVMKPENEAELRRSGKALGRALRDGYPGVVTVMGENVVMERSRKVYTPMTIVE